MLSIAVGVELIHNLHLLSFIPGIADRMLKMSFKFDRHGGTMTGGFSLALPVFATSINRGLPEAVTCIRKTKEGLVRFEFGLF